ncbi:hypothetical protein ABIA32_001052 [Streptacidiphilus sp. MAP12-20]|uniref:CBM35 domain-containing protein n=1 Tax=Streptacidiphilus sp. MAP12-20 TaxID=3156299 RepID=UPI0035130424
MTAENNGVPEDDDPFAYLYRAEGDAAGAEVAAPTQPMPGVPRTSYQQATQVGRTQYGQQPGYAQQSQQPQQGYGYPSVPHQAPPAPPADGGRAAARAGGGGSGGSSRGVMIGAVAVGVAIVIGILFAIFSNNDNKTGGSAAGTGSSQSSVATGSASASASASPSAALPGATDAATMTLQGTAATTTPAGAKAAGGSSVPLTNATASVTWTVTIPADGQYYLWIRYNNMGADAKAQVLVNGKKSREADFKNYSHPTDPSQAWYRTYNQPDLKAGQVQITIQGIAGQPAVSIDQLAITAQKVSPW